MVRKFRVKINGKVFEVEVEDLTSKEESLTQSFKTETVEASPKPEKPRIAEKPKVKPEKPLSTEPQQQTTEKPVETEHSKKEAKEDLKVITAPMSGVVISVDVEPGAKVSVGQTLLVLEAMKMENSLISEYEGVVKEVFVKKGDNIETGQRLLTIV